MVEERLQKVLASSGVASRRASEALIAAGRVTVDGRRASLGERVDPSVARIEVDGVPVGIGTARTYLALHKPAGVTSTTQDRHALTTVLDLIPTALVPDGTRLYPVGRLDQDSEGLLLLTNDGDWAERVLHPRFGVEREYAVAVARALEPEQVRALGAGVALDEGIAHLAGPLRAATAIETRRLAGLLDPEPDPRLLWYRATLAQGWKRQLRRMFAAVGAPVQRLVRVRIGSVRVDGLACGAVRRLKAPEIRLLGEGRTRPPAQRGRASRVDERTPRRATGAPASTRSTARPARDARGGGQRGYPRRDGPTPGPGRRRGA